MDYRSLGRTGLKVSKLALGAMMFGGRADEAQSRAIIETALERGVNLIDTADVYSKGRSEEIVGATVSDLGVRGDVVLATKFHGRTGPGPNAAGNHRRHVVEACEASLRRLRTDTIDLYQIHRPCSEIPIDETLRALDDLVRAGKIRYIGTSTFAAWQIVESLWVSRELGLNRVVSEQPPYHLLDRRVERELLPMTRTFGIAVLAWSPLAGGFLSGKYKRGGETDDATDTRLDERAKKGTIHFTEAAFQVVDTLDEIARGHGATPAQIALAWCVQQPGVTGAILGPRTVAQLEEDLGAWSIHLSDDELGKLDAVAEPGRAIAPYYQADFGPHHFRW